jgi:hypothetical protein
VEPVSNIIRYAQDVYYRNDFLKCFLVPRALEAAGVLPDANNDFTNE